jgi:serine/threonine protein kinase
MDHPSRVGKYEIEQFLGGGMSHVYRARDTVLGRRVALKLLTSAGAADEESKSRFLQEARTASNIVHENIISVFDFGEDNGLPFIVMEYLDGESLRSAIRNGRAGDFANRMHIALQVARAVDYIHSKKVIHRDIKPENIHIDETGKVKLMDFGIAKSDGVQLTRAGFTLGTPYYMAPEQVLGRALTPQADVYSFGVMLYELLTGMRAVSGDKVDAIFDQILHQPLDLSALDRLNIPIQVSTLIRYCTAKPPAQRPPGLGEVAEQIEQVVVTTASTRPIKLPKVPRIPAKIEDTGAFDLDPGLRGLPPWLQRTMLRFPRAMRAPMGVMAVAAIAVFGFFVLIYFILVLAHIV